MGSIELVTWLHEGASVGDPLRGRCMLQRSLSMAREHRPRGPIL